MISFAEFEIAVRGLLRLARFDAAFAGFFDLSREGARRSFRLAFALLPVYLLLIHLNSPWPPEMDIARIVSAELIGYALMWTCFPLLLLYGAQMLKPGPRIFGAVAVYNWISVLSLGIQVPISIAVYLGLDAQVGDLLGHGVDIFVIACEFFAFKRLLEIAFEGALALAVVDFILGRAIVYLVIVPLARGPLF
ncbi:MAG: hypothetical protein ABUL54_08630 [Dongia sp.]